MYVGQGVEGRHNHCLSGISHNKRLNRYYFSNGEDESMVVEVKHKNLTKEDALSIERDLIRTLNPVFNRDYNNLGRKVVFDSDYVTLQDFVKQSNTYGEFFDSIRCLDKECYEETIQRFSQIARDMAETGRLDKLISLCGEESLYKTPFIVFTKGEWVFNRASEDLFGSSVSEIKNLI